MKFARASLVILSAAAIAVLFGNCAKRQISPPTMVAPAYYQIDTPGK